MFFCRQMQSWEKRRSEPFGIWRRGVNVTLFKQYVSDSHPRIPFLLRPNVYWVFGVGSIPSISLPALTLRCLFSPVSPHSWWNVVSTLWWRPSKKPSLLNVQEWSNATKPTVSSMMSRRLCVLETQFNENCVFNDYWTFVIFWWTIKIKISFLNTLLK